jgi:hypothetical protein
MRIGIALPRQPFIRLLTLDDKQLSKGHSLAVDADPEVRLVLDSVVRSFATGYNTALATPRGTVSLTEMPHEFRGFAFEGAAMSRTLLDVITLTRGRRLGELACGPGQAYPHLIHVGAGWAFARLHISPWRMVRYGEPLLRWLAWDGLGFHQAYFHPRAVLLQHKLERVTSSSVRSIRDQGAGRALWFYTTAEPARIAEIIGSFPSNRRPDLWAGIGLAAAYTGAQPPNRLSEVLDSAEGQAAHVAQGAAFAAKAHLVSGQVPPRSAAAIETLTGADPETAAQWTDESLAEAARGDDSPAGYERWRAGIRRIWESQKRMCWP